MKVQKVDNTHFGALIRIKSPEELFAQANQMLNNISPEYRGLMAGTSSTASSSAGSGLITTGSASNSLATGFDVVGTAYCAKAAGIDSFGIVPSAAAKSASVLTPKTLASSAENPSVAGSIFSGLGAFIHRHFKLFGNSPKKIPS